MSEQKLPQRLKLIFFGSTIDSGEKAVNDFLAGGADVVELDLVDNEVCGVPLLQIWYREPNGNPPLAFRYLEFHVDDHKIREIEDKINEFLVENSAERVLSRMRIRYHKVQEQGSTGAYDRRVWMVTFLLVYLPGNAENA